MNGADRGTRRLLRLELRSSRTGAATVVAALLLAAVLAAIAASVWTLDARGASTVQTGLASAAKAWAEPSWRAVAAVAAGIVGIALVVLAVTPRHRRRHGRAAGPVALVVDDGLLADAAAQAVARRCMLPTSQVSATVTARRVQLRIRPVSGVPVDEAGAADAAQHALQRLGFAARAVVTVEARGVVA